MKHIGIRRLAVCLLTCILLLTSALPIYAAKDAVEVAPDDAPEVAAKATDMRLVSAEGTLTLKNASGRELKVREGMKLYSKYTLTTDKESYAYLSLDSEKAIKLDAGSSLEIRKQGKKLELLLKSGRLLFDVKSPLEDGETMNIRTSTMVTGIRGTVGIVTASADASSLLLLEGSATVSLADGSDLKVVTAGSVGFCAQEQIIIETSDADRIPGFAAVLLKEDDTLAARVENATGWELHSVILDSHTRLDRDEQQATTQTEPPQTVKQVFSDEEFRLDLGLPGTLIPSRPGTTTPPTPTPPTPPAPVVYGTLTIEVNLADTLGAALQPDTDRTFTFSVTDAEGASRTASVTVAQGTSFGTVTVADLPVGVYTVTQTTPNLTTDIITTGGNDYTFDTMTPAVTVTIAESALDQTAAFTNSYAQVIIGSITMEVSLTDTNGNALVSNTDKTFTFTVTDSDSAVQTLTVTVAAGTSFGTGAIVDLPADVYTVDSPVLTGDTVAQGSGSYTFNRCDPDSNAVLVDGNAPDVTVQTTVVYTPSAYTLSTAATATELQSYLDQFETITVQAPDTATADMIVSISAGETVTVPTGKLLVLADWVQSTTGDYFSIQLSNGGTLINYGTIEVIGSNSLTGDAAGVIDNYGTMILNDACTNTGILNIKNGGTVDVNSHTYTNAGTWNIEAGGVMTSDTFSNNGTMSLAGQLTVERNFGNTGTFTVENGGTVINSAPTGAEGLLNYAGGNMTIEAGGVLLGTGQVDNLGTLTNNSTVTASGKFRNLDGGTLFNNGSFSVEGTFQNGDWTLATGGSDGGSVENNGTFTVLATGVVDNHAGTFTNMTTGIMDIRGSFTAATGYKLPGHLDNQGTLQISGTLTIAGDPSGTADRQASALSNSGTVTVQESGTLVIATDADTVENNGTITCSGTITNSGGTVTNNTQLLIDSGILDNAGTVDNYGQLTVSGASGVLNNLENNGTIWNNGEITLLGNSTMNNQGSLFNGQSRSDTAVTFSNYGILNTSGYLENYGTFTNYAEMNNTYFYNYGTFENTAGATVTNTGDFINQMNGSVLNNGAVDNTGTVTNDGTYSGSGTVSGTGNINGTNTEPLLTLRLSTGTYTAEEMHSYFENYKIIIVEGESNVTVSAPVTASEPLTLTDGKSFQIEWDATFTCNAPITVLTGGSMEIGVGGGAATVTMNEALTVNGGTLTLINGDFTIGETGSITLEGGSMIMQEPSSEYVEIYGRLINNGTVTVGANATLTAYSKILNYGVMTVKANGLLNIAYNSSGTTLYDVGLENGDGAGKNGTLIIEAGATVEMSGLYSNLTQAIHYGMLENHAGSTLTNNGSITGSNYCKLVNDGTYSGSGTVSADIVCEGANADQVTVPTP